MRIVAEPGVIAAAVQADVADAGGGALGGLHGAADDRLIDVAEADAALVQHGVEFFVVPGGVANFHHQRIIGELFEKLFQVGHGFGRVVKGKRKLQQNRAQFFCGNERSESLADGFSSLLDAAVAPGTCGPDRA